MLANSGLMYMQFPRNFAQCWRCTINSILVLASSNEQVSQHSRCRFAISKSPAADYCDNANNRDCHYPTRSHTGHGHSYLKRLVRSRLRIKLENCSFVSTLSARYLNWFRLYRTPQFHRRLYIKCHFTCVSSSFSLRHFHAPLIALIFQVRNSSAPQFLTFFVCRSARFSPKCLLYYLLL